MLFTRASTGRLSFSINRLISCLTLHDFHLTYNDNDDKHIDPGTNDNDND